MNTAAVKDLLFRLADDELIIGHRNSEWTSLGPILEEDIAFASMAQDELGHAQAYYQLLHQLGEAEPDALAFGRKVEQMRCCHLVEMPIGDYAFSLVRHFLYDVAEDVRLRHLAAGSYAPLAELAKKLAREEKYHLLHAKTWMAQLAAGGEEGRLRLQTALNEALPIAFGLFEETEHSQALADEGVQPAEKTLAAEWLEGVSAILQKTPLKLPAASDPLAFYGGRKGFHTEHLAPLLQEMTEVFAIEPTAKW